MSTGAIIGIVVAAVVILLVVVVAIVIRDRRRSSRLHERFGPEYERALARSGSRKSAEQELQARLEERQQIDLRELPASDRDRYSQEWRRIQADFVDSPARALKEADALLSNVMRARGYGDQNFDRRTDLLSVEHPRLVTHYRQAHDIQLGSDRGEASTEHVRQAFVAYRELFGELLDHSGDHTAEVNHR